ncbi:MAG: TRAP transporter small permease [Spirochaetaceae bacterium]|nr:MAG: TRAP transporter small permease [Spirochaetaceae bacterium]
MDKGETMTARLLGVLRAIAAITYRVSKLAIVLALGLLVVLVALQVYFRYVLRDSLVWAIELSTLLMVWIVFLGCSIAYRDNEIIAVCVVTDRLPRRLRKAVALVVDSIMLGFLVFVIHLNRAILPMVARTPMPVLRISSFWKHVSLTVAFSIMCFYCVLHMIEELSTIRAHDEESDSQ